MTHSKENRNQIRYALRDLVLILGTLFIFKNILLTVESLWTFAGPIALLLSLAVATWCLRDNGETWQDLGLKKIINNKQLLKWTLIALAVTVIADILIQVIISNVITPNDTVNTIDERYQGRFANLPGNFPVFLFWLMIAWVIGGFTEEMLFRGMLISRFERFFSKAPYAIVLAIVLQAFIFGQQHYYYQGLTGWIANSVIALISGILYLKFKRNLWPLVLSHGLANSIGLTLLYFGIGG